MSGQAVQAVLRGGPSHGLHVTALADPDRAGIDSFSRSGYTYRDSGHALQGRQIYDWLPADPARGCREIPMVSAALQH